jgi:Uma2 family endonuclease
MLLAEPTTRRWTKAEYYRMADLGFFQDQRAELIEGEIVVLSPQKFSHGATTDRIAEVLRGVYGTGAWVRMQSPIDLGPISEPEPDVSVVRGRREDYTDHPLARGALLVVEVSDTTLAYDRGPKSSLYAKVGIADYWIADLVHRQLEVRRNPVADPAERHGWRYADVDVLGLSQAAVPLSLPAARVAVSDLLR